MAEMESLLSTYCTLAYTDIVNEYNKKKKKFFLGGNNLT